MMLENDTAAIMEKKTPQLAADIRATAAACKPTSRKEGHLPQYVNWNAIIEVA